MTRRDEAARALAVAQQKLDVLNRLPEHDNFPDQTVVRWRKAGKAYWKYSVKWGNRWRTTGTRSDLYIEWQGVLTLIGDDVEEFEVMRPDDTTSFRPSFETPPATVDQTNTGVFMDYLGSRFRWNPNERRWEKVS